MSKEPIVNALWISEYEAHQLRRKREAERRRMALWLALFAFTGTICIAAAAWVLR